MMHTEPAGRISCPRNLGLSFSFIVTNYKEVYWSQLGMVITISLRTSSRKLATSAAVGPLNFLGTLHFLSVKNRSNTWKNDSEVVPVLFNGTKLSGRIIEELAVSSPYWIMEMLTIADMYPTGDDGMNRG